MKKRSSFILLFLITIFMASYLQDTYAMVVNNLYVTELEAIDKTIVERKRLFLQAFEQVLLKLTGNPEHCSATQIQQATKQIDKYVSSFSYKNITAGDTFEDILKIQVVFNEKMINALLEEAKIPYLGKNRPVTLTWLLIDTYHGFRLVEEQEQDFFVAKLEQLALKHSIPLVLPLLDLNELNRIQVNDILDGATSISTEAAVKYNADLVLVGKITSFAGEWRAKWSILGGSDLEWYTKGATIEELYEQLMQMLRNKLITNYAVNTQDQTTTNIVKVKVEGINSLDSYAKILTYLRGLAAVNLVKVTTITTNNATFELNINGKEEIIKKTINLDRLLEDVTFDEAYKELHELHYRVGGL